MWLNKLKIAIIEKDVDTLNLLMDDLPHLDKEEDIESAIFLLKEATSVVKTLQSTTQESMIQMKKNINFLKATQSPVSGTLDVTS